jgi:hypothetical protein
MTPQEQNQRSFDRAAVALVKQGKPSLAPDGLMCLYRGPGGARCAAGWLFEGEVDKDFTEGTTCTERRVRALLAANGHDPSFVSVLQSAHDTKTYSLQWLDEWENAMRGIACLHELSTAALDAALAARLG